MFDTWIRCRTFSVEVFVVEHFLCSLVEQFPLNVSNIFCRKLYCFPFVRAIWCSTDCTSRRRRHCRWTVNKSGTVYYRSPYVLKQKCKRVDKANGYKCRKTGTTIKQRFAGMRLGIFQSSFMKLKSYQSTFSPFSKDTFKSYRTHGSVRCVILYEYF